MNKYVAILLVIFGITMAIFFISRMGEIKTANEWFSTISGVISAVFLFVILLLVRKKRINKGI